MVFQLVLSILITILSFSAYFMLRYIRKHPHLLIDTKAEKK